jgi:hypothetical protein
MDRRRWFHAAPDCCRYLRSVGIIWSASAP